MHFKGTVTNAVGQTLQIWLRLLYKTLFHLYVYMKMQLFSLYSSLRLPATIRVYFRFMMEVWNTGKLIITQFLLDLEWWTISSLIFPLTSWIQCCVMIKFSDSLFSCSTWPQLWSDWRLKIQMLTYSPALSEYEKKIVGGVWSFTAKVENSLLR